MLQRHGPFMTARPCIPRCALRWVWLCVLLCWAVAYAAPLVNPHAMTLVCSSTGVTKWVGADNDPLDNGRRLPSLDCAQCLPSALPPPSFHEPPLARLPRGDIPAQVTRHLIARIVAIPPARGPPVFPFPLPT